MARLRFAPAWQRSLFYAPLQKRRLEARGLRSLAHPISFPVVEFCFHAFGFGGKGIRTPDFQLAKLALYQLSYAPAGTPNAFACSRLMSELPNVDFRISNARNKTKCRMAILLFAIRHSCASSNEQTCVRTLQKRPSFPCISVPRQVPPNMQLRRR